MRYLRPLLGPDRGWRRAVPACGSALLNAGWHRRQGVPGSRACPVCGSAAVAADHAVHHGGELYHADCAPYSWEQP